MPSRIPRAATIAVCFFLAAVPPVGFMRYLESHALASAEETLNDYAGRMVGHVDQRIDDGVQALTSLFKAGVVRCGAGAQEEMRRAIFKAYLLREIAVIGPGNAVLCGDSIIDTERWTLSSQTAADGAVDVSVAIAFESLERSLALRFRPTAGPSIVAHFAPDSLALDVLPEPWRRRGYARLALIDGTQFETFPPESSQGENAQADDVVRVQVASDRYPVKVEILVSKAAVMEQYRQLEAYLFAAMIIFASIVVALAVVVARRRPSLGDDIASGLRRGEFIPFYQPVINLSSGRLEGCEVLVRRRRPGGVIDVPASFINQAEVDGQIVPITRALMRQVIRDLGDVYGQWRDLTVAFNLCAQHFRDDGIIRDVETLFTGSPIHFEQLVFEVTERFPLSDMAKAKTIIARLQAFGAKIALDDAGTGHSGLASLHRLGMDIVKIDKLFIDPIDSNTTSAPIVDTFVELSESLGMSVVAEGVETLDQVRYLRAKGVQTAQGYLFAPPLPASSYVSLVLALMPKPEESVRANWRRRETA